MSFSTGDIIEIVEETSAGWWIGKFNGKQAMFPSNYVERIESAPAVSGAAGPAKKPYKPFGAALHGSDLPPQAGQGVNSLGLQEKEGTEEKKNKFGKYGNTVRHVFRNNTDLALMACDPIDSSFCGWRCWVWRW